MTEAYAATIAAVAPVIWLVLAIEANQYVKRWEALEPYGAAVRRARRLAECVDGRISDEERGLIREALEEGERLLPRDSSTLPTEPWLSAAYSSLAVMLLSPELFALWWLAGERGPEPVLAWLCFVTVTIGFVAVMALPIGYSYRTLRRGNEQRRQDWEWLAEFSRRQEELASSDDSAPGRQPTPQA